jgi:hypothetical protein
VSPLRSIGLGLECYQVAEQIWPIADAVVASAALGRFVVVTHERTQHQGTFFSLRVVFALT